MTDMERAAIDAMVNRGLQWLVLIVVLGWWAWYAWHRWVAPYLSSVFPNKPAPIMSNSQNAEKSLASRPRTDAPADGRTEPQQPAPHPVTVDTARQLRAHGFTRDEARAFLKTLGWTLGNDTWSKAQPEEEPQMTPVAGRPTNATFREEGALAYKDPPQ